MGREEAPLPVSSQWSEARGFERIYHRNPIYQARFAMTLLGFRETVVHEASGDETGEEIAAIDTVLRTFCTKHPEFMFPEFTGDNELAEQTYRADPRLIGLMNEVLSSRE